MQIEELNNLNCGDLVKCRVPNTPGRIYQQGKIYKVLSVKYFKLTNGQYYPIVETLDTELSSEYLSKVGFMYYEVDLVKRAQHV